MPRKPKDQHVVRSIRNILGLTERNFSTLVGIGIPRLKKIVQGRELKWGEAIKITAATGASTRELLKGKSGKAVSDLDPRQPFTREVHERWRQCVGWLDSHRMPPGENERERFQEGDILDIKNLRLELQRGSLGSRIREQLPVTARGLLETNDVDERKLRRELVEGLNRIIRKRSIYESELFRGIELRADTRSLLAETPKGKDLCRLNRMLLEDAFPNAFSKRPKTAEVAAEDLSRDIWVFARCICLAAARTRSPKLFAVQRAMVVALDEICTAFGLRTKMWEEAVSTEERENVVPALSNVKKISMTLENERCKTGNDKWSKKRKGYLLTFHLKQDIMEILGGDEEVLPGLTWSMLHGLDGKITPGQEFPERETG